MKRRWLFWILIIAFLWVVISRFADIEKLVKTLEGGQWQWVAVAGLLQILYYIVYTWLYQSAFDTVEVRSRIGELLPVTFASIFVNVAAPTAGASGAALFVDDARHRGESPGRATVGTLLSLVADFVAFLFVLAFALIYLIANHVLQSYEVVGIVILLAMVGGLIALLMLGLWQPDWLRGILNWIQRAANGLAARLKRTDFLSPDWAQRTTSEFTEAAIAINTHPTRLIRTLVVALVAHAVDLLSLYVIFLAFHEKVDLGVLVAGYAMGILFWIVSITPQGIGVVEGVMTLVFASLGVSLERAAVIAVSFRGLTFWIPLGIGFLLLRRVKTFGAAETTRSEIWSVRLVALLAGVMGIINVLSAVTPSLRNRVQLLEQYSPLSVAHGGHLTAALAGFALMLLAFSLWRRKRVAWLFSIVLLFVSAVAHMLKGLDYEEAVFALGLAALLIYLRPHFHARSDSPSIWQGAQTLLAALAFTTFYGVAGFFLLDRHFKVHFGLGAALRQTVVMFTQFYDPGLQPITGFGRYFADSIYLVGMVTFGYAALMLIRPVLIRHRVSPQERAHAGEIARAFGHSSLARLTLLDDKFYYFTAGGSVIAYVVKGRVALTLGDPIGPPDDFVASVNNFQALCTRNDWLPAFYQVLPEHLDDYETAGFSALLIGQEGIVNTATFTLDGSQNKPVRNAYNKIVRLGFTAEVVMPPHPSYLMRDLRQISDEWLTIMNGTEKRFSLGWFDEKYLNSCPIMLVKNSEGTIESFANILIEFQASEATIDLMRHRRDAEKGQMDFLFVSIFQWAQEQGFVSFNLGLSALSGVGENPEDPAIERALHYIYEHIDQFYNFKGLHAFKEKFHPVWSPRYLIYPGAGSLPAVTIAMIRADSGDDVLGGYLRHPR